MDRRSVNLSIIPMRGTAGVFNIWLHCSTWVGNDCQIAEQICTGQVIDMPDATSEAEVLHFVLEALDRAYQEVSVKLSRVNRPSVTETNARPSDTSVPS